MTTTFKRGDLRRIWIVLGAVIELPRPSVLAITEATKLPRPSVMDALNKAVSGQIPGLVLKKEQAVYSLADTGPLLNRSGLSSYFKEYLSSTMDKDQLQGAQH